MKLKSVIQQNEKKFLQICETHKIQKLYALGSSVYGNFVEGKSDFDFVVEIFENDPITKGKLLLNLAEELREFFDAEIDLMTMNSLKNPILIENIENSKLLIYEHSQKKVFE